MRNSKDKDLDVSVIIVSYNTKEKTHTCLQSIKDMTEDITYEVIVSDNGSSDDTVGDIKKFFPWVRLIENHKNLGFGRANNVGLKEARGKYILYLNSDTWLENNAIKVLYDFWKENEDSMKLGAIGGQLLDAKHKKIHSGGYSVIPADLQGTG